MFKQHLGKIFIVLAVLAIGGAVVYANHVSNQANEGVVIEPNVKGNPDAAVTLVKYSDFQCPACGQFAPYVNELATRLPRRLADRVQALSTDLHPSVCRAGCKSD